MWKAICRLSGAFLAFRTLYGRCWPLSASLRLAGLVSVGFLALCLPVSAQNARFDGIALNRNGFPAPGALIAVCTQPCTVPTNVSVSAPPSPLAATCSSATDAVCTSPNPITADGLGNYFGYVKPGTYTLVFYGSGLTTRTQIDQLLGCDATVCAFNTSLEQIVGFTTPNGAAGTTALMLGKEVGNTLVDTVNGDSGSNIKLFPVAANISGQCAAGTTGNACKVIVGKALVTMDTGGVAVNDFVGVSSTQAPKGMDIGASVPPGQSCAGKALASAASGATVIIDTNACAVPAATGYATVQDATNGLLAQQTKLYCTGGIACSNDAGNNRTQFALANPVSLSAGTKAAPSLTGPTATTGWYWPDAISTWFAVANANVLRISSGSISVGASLIFGGCDNAACSSISQGIAFPATGKACSSDGGSNCNGNFGAAIFLVGGADVGLSRDGPGILDVGTGAQGSKAGTVNAAVVNAGTNFNAPDQSGYQVAGLQQTVFVAGDFTTANNANLQTITGLTWTLPALTVLKVPFSCHFAYSQATGTAAVAFGVQSATISPTNFLAIGSIATNTTVFAEGNATITNSTATAVVSATPSAITTVWNAELHGFIENPSNASTNVINIMVSTANGADAVTVKRGSYCRLF